MNVRKIFLFITSMILAGIFAVGCGQMPVLSSGGGSGKTESAAEAHIKTESGYDAVALSSEITQLEDGFWAVHYEENYGFDEFLSQGGASSDGEVIRFLAGYLKEELTPDFLKNIFGCSTIMAVKQDGKFLFGRNFDWDRCNAMVVSVRPEHGYGSISTVNMDFVTQGIGGGAMGAALKSDRVRTMAALYAPLDGMNEAGLAVSVNMIQDHASIGQNTEKPDITTTTAVRLLLDQAADVGEALELLGKYDMHASMGMMVHFALADSSGRSVVVEYIDNQMVVTATPVVTNFYLAEGDKNGIGTAQSHERYEILMNLLQENETMTTENVRDALDRVSKDNFGEFESTEWSIVFDLNSGTAHYYHRENYEKPYIFAIKPEDG